MTYAVQFTSLKGRTAGTVKLETYDTEAEAEFAARAMRAGSHRDAKVVLLEDKIFFIVDSVDEKIVFRSIRRKCDGTCNLMNKLNHQADGPFGGGRYYVTDQEDQ